MPSEARKAMSPTLPSTDGTVGQIAIVGRQLPVQSVTPRSQEESIARKYQDCRIKKVWRVSGDAKKSQSPRNVQGLIFDLFKSHLATKGNVFVKSISIEFATFTPGAMVGATIVPSTETLTGWDDLQMSDNHQMRYTNDANKGLPDTIKLTIPDSCAAQISPPSSFLSPPTLWLKASAEMKVLHAIVTLTYDCSVMLIKDTSAFQ